MCWLVVYKLIYHGAITTVSVFEINILTFKSNNQNLIVKTDKNTNYDIDSVLKLQFNKEDCYFFDTNSEDRLRI